MKTRSDRGVFALTRCLLSLAVINKEFASILMAKMSAFVDVLCWAFSEMSTHLLSSAVIAIVLWEVESLSKQMIILRSWFAS